MTFWIVILSIFYGFISIGIFTIRLYHQCIQNIILITHVHVSLSVPDAFQSFLPSLTPLLPAGPRVRGVGGAVQWTAQQAGQRIASPESEPLALQPHQLHHYLLWPKVWGKVIPGGQKGMRQTCPYLAVTVTMLSCPVDF